MLTFTGWTGQPCKVPCHLVSRVNWIMWWGSPSGAGDLTTGQMTLTQVGSFWHKAQLTCLAKPAVTARGLEVSVSHSGPPQPTDSEPQGQRRGCRTPLLDNALKQKTHKQHKHDNWRGKKPKNKNKKPFKRITAASSMENVQFYLLSIYHTA